MLYVDLMYSLGVQDAVSAMLSLWYLVCVRACAVNINVIIASNASLYFCKRALANLQLRCR